MSIFTDILVKTPKSSTQNLSHQNLMTLRFGELVPFFQLHVVPGDKCKVGEQHKIDLAPLVHPIMHQVNVFMHYFFVPYRLIYDDWEKFIAGEKKEDGTDYQAPYFNVHTREKALLLQQGLLSDYLGVPPVIDIDNWDTAIKFSSLPFRAYHLIYNEYFRDQNLINETYIYKGSGEEDFNAGKNTIHRRAWHKDYFTSALTSPDRGVDVTLPIEGDVDIEYQNKGYTRIMDSSGSPMTSSMNGKSLVSNNSTMNIGEDGQYSNANIDNSQQLKGSLSQANMPTIQNLRRAFKLQQFLERQARTGSRYIEMLKAFFGVTSSDARLQRPQYLAGVKCPILIDEVVQTSETATTPQANRAGMGQSLNTGFAFSRRFEEHGIVMGIMSIMPKASYMQGISRDLTRLTDRFDYYWPDFQNIGEQEIKNKELYFAYHGGAAYNEQTFGYAPRYSEYKYKPSEVHGEFRSSLANWHLGRIFANAPHLNKSFIEYNPDNANRVFAVSEDYAAPVYAQIYNRVIMKRPMQKYSDPHL